MAQIEAMIRLRQLGCHALDIAQEARRGQPLAGAAEQQRIPGPIGERDSAGIRGGSVHFRCVSM
jgi:hypothetical protein